MSAVCKTISGIITYSDPSVGVVEYEVDYHLGLCLCKRLIRQNEKIDMWHEIHVKPLFKPYVPRQLFETFRMLWEDSKIEA